MLLSTAGVLNILTLLLTLTLTPTFTLARQPPTSFCKCICFQNSTIIPLNSPQQSPGRPSPSASNPDAQPPESSTSISPSPSGSSLFAKREEDEDGHDSSVHHRLSCSDCTRAFCLDYNLPICKGAKDEDVFTTCFQRDSVKDETIVLLFIVVTTGLLGWAVVKPWVDKFRMIDTSQTYAPIGNSSTGPSRRGNGLPSYRDSTGEETGRRTRERGGSETFARQGGLNS